MVLCLMPAYIRVAEVISELPQYNIKDTLKISLNVPLLHLLLK